MTATDELRRMLDEHGESWHKWPDEDSTTWQAYSDPHTATESMDGTLIVTGLTPAQAIAATLGDADAKCERHGDVEIVRCRDCKHYSEHEWVLVTDVSDVCRFWHGEPTKVEPDGFCAWGERKGVD